MKLYAEKPWRFTRQIVADMAAIVWSAVWIWAAVTLYHLVQKLAVPGQKLESAGGSLAADLTSVQDRARGIPLVGDQVSAPFGNAAKAAGTIAEAGRDQQDAVGSLATALAWLTAGIPVLMALVLWLPLRMSWIRAASTAAKLRRYEGGSELLALRALATAPLRRVASLDSTVVAGWRRGDTAAIDQLAALELRRLGLRGSPRE
ncbi:hypothetical protein Cs7R123_27090 [Catellatospora sp. TT07R-123]|uniref:hypothetical protein n=1 Tax=Catellatospora sp. TT07R-123 TaxID=2733863 RepID=UPI001B251ED1|nr:hypothetical protein [Catellatospora sp. TT07R-123]GHJ45367.1 hypothetical protein Cs7R123_27090 [Catellatospora sp. TT07R-123]